MVYIVGCPFRGSVVGGVTCPLDLWVSLIYTFHYRTFWNILPLLFCCSMFFSVYGIFSRKFHNFLPCSSSLL